MAGDGRGVSRSAPVALGQLHPSGLSPASGELRGVGDAVELFLRARAQRATGRLGFGGDAGILLAHGVPAGLIGSDVLPSFLRLVADIGHIGENEARSWLTRGHPSPRSIARAMKSRGLIDGDEAVLLPARHLEDRLVRALQVRGPWRFEPRTDGLCTDDLVPRTGELRDWLLELLPRAASEAELRAALGLGTQTVAIIPGTEHFVAERDLPLVGLLDGRRSLEAAARLAGLPMGRALAWGLVWLREGLAERVERPAGPPPIRPSRAEEGTPTLADLPPLRPREPKSPAWPQAFRLEARTRRPPLEQLDADARVRALAEVVRTRDYFDILSVDATATEPAIAEAHRRVRSLVPKRVPAELEAIAREVLRSVDEARDVLLIPELRAAYEQHLDR